MRLANVLVATLFLTALVTVVPTAEAIPPGTASFWAGAGTGGGGWSAVKFNSTQNKVATHWITAWGPVSEATFNFFLLSRYDTPLAAATIVLQTRDSGTLIDVRGPVVPTITYGAMNPWPASGYAYVSVGVQWVSGVPGTQIYKSLATVSGNAYYWNASFVNQTGVKFMSRTSGNESWQREARDFTGTLHVEAYPTSGAGGHVLKDVTYKHTTARRMYGWFMYLSPDPSPVAMGTITFKSAAGTQVRRDFTQYTTYPGGTYVGMGFVGILPGTQTFGVETAVEASGTQGWRQSKVLLSIADVTLPA